MIEFTQQELTFIAQVLSQLSWKAGQSEAMAIAESIIVKCSQTEGTVASDEA
ncbi:MAG: hypothetical protein GY820_12685 [Gammaproteobacteria bacterium]|nr:hypothetical protein [Bacteroidota bacterium]MCP4488159.1 hypothetical protein [Gammaproteobacteria bacterium]